LANLLNPVKEAYRPLLIKTSEMKVLPSSPAETNVGSGIYQGSGTGNMTPYACLVKRANVVYCQHIHAVALRTD